MEILHSKIQRKTKSNTEYRTYSLDSLCIEKREDLATRKIVGHAAVFNIIDGPEWFREQIAPGAFAESLDEDDVRALFNHDPNLVLGRNKAGTLTLEEDDVGLSMSIDVPDTTVGNDLLKSIERGDITQASFAFETLDASWETIDGTEVRTIKKAKLYDVSPVTYPFYEATDVALRKAQWDEKQRLQQEKPQRTVNVRRRRFALRHHT